MAGKGLLERIEVVGLMRRGLPNGAQCHNHASHDSPHALRAQTHRTLRDDTGEGTRGRRAMAIWFDPRFRAGESRGRAEFPLTVRDIAGGRKTLSGTEAEVWPGQRPGSRVR